MIPAAGRRGGAAALACIVLLLSAACVQQAQAPAGPARPQISRPPVAAAPAQPAPKPARPAANTLAALPEADPQPDRSLEPAVAETFVGHASWYGRKFHGRLTASGERYDMAAFTAAHRKLPFGSRVRVTNLANGRAVVVTINDRGPFAEDRLIDLSHAAAKQLGIVEDGVAEVRLEVLAESTDVAG